MNTQRQSGRWMNAQTAAGKPDSCAQGGTELVGFFSASGQYAHYVQIRLNINVWVCVQSNRNSSLSSTVHVCVGDVWTGGQLDVSVKLTVVCSQLEQKNSNLGLQHIPEAPSASQCGSESTDQQQQQQQHPHCAVVSLKVKETGK